MELREVVQEVTESMSATFARAQVKDSGTGIDHKDLPHVFERFYRGDRQRAKSKSKPYRSSCTSFMIGREFEYSIQRGRGTCLIGLPWEHF
ncbi:hypothetical protein YSY22_27220 [Brevibacillus formosus]